MSSKALYNLLMETYENLSDTVQIDESGAFDTNTQIRLINEYLHIYSNLEECYDQTIHTQRRVNIRQMLQATTTRLLDLINQAYIDGTHWPEVASIIMSQSQTINLEVPIPRIIKDDQGQAFVKREELISKNEKQFEEARIANDMSKPPSMPIDEACLIIQRAERARHSRHETLIKQGIQLQQDTMHKQTRLADREKSATIIKQFWKKYGQRYKEKLAREQELVLIGMKPTPPSTELKDQVEHTGKRRKEEQRKRRMELEAAEEVSRAWLRDNKEVELRRKLDELAANFYNETKLKTGKAPVIKAKTKVVQPLLEGVDFEPEPLLQDYFESIKPKPKKGAEEEKPKKEAPKKPGNKKEVVIIVPENVKAIKDALEAFKGQWVKTEEPTEESQMIDSDQKANAGDNQIGDQESIAPISTEVSGPVKDPWSDDFDLDLVRHEMWVSMLPEIATSCEEKLKRELYNLKLLEAARCRKAKAPRQKKKRQRKQRDPLKGKTHESIVSDLVGLGILQNTPSTTFKNFIGEYDFTSPVAFRFPNDPEKQPPANMKIDNYIDEPSPSYAAIRNQAIIEGVLPFATNREVPKIDIPKGILFAGMKGTGKTTLALATANALGATFLNFSPSVLAGKQTPSPKILILMLMKIARDLAPSVILVDDIEKMFGPKKKADSSKKFKAQLKKNLKKVKPKDRILFLATTSMPNLNKGILSMFSRVINIPAPNFPTRVLLWNYWLAKTNLMIPTINVNALSFASEGYTAASISRACQLAEKVKISRTEPNDPISDQEVLHFLGEAPEEESKTQYYFYQIGPKPPPQPKK